MGFVKAHLFKPAISSTLEPSALDSTQPTALSYNAKPGLSIDQKRKNIGIQGVLRPIESVKDRGILSCHPTHLF